MMESCMRQGLTLVAVFIGAGLGLGITSHDADARTFAGGVLSGRRTRSVIEAGWRRNWRRYGPQLSVVPDADVDVDVDVTCPARHLP